MKVMKGKLVAGVLYDGEISLWDWAVREMSRLWGEVQRISDMYPFTCTNYYKEIGDPLFRRFLSFKNLSEGNILAKRKIQAIALEQRSGTPRKINIDPGLLDGARLILASTKDRAQRIPISETLYAEVTLRYKKKRWTPFDYTFPDFQETTYYPFLEKIRTDVLEEIHTPKEEKHK